MSEARRQPAAIGPFVVLRKLGEGAMGVVYAGYDVALDRKVALKLVRPALVHNPSVRARMVREAQAMARLSHPNVVQVYQVGEHEDGLYVAMEYIDGRTLGEWLRAEPRPWQAALRTVCDAGRGLAAAHAAGLVHRDFKPDNVIVDASGRARVLDFGLVQSGAIPGGELEEGAESTHEAETESTMSAGSATLQASAVRWSGRLTEHGKVAGTPAYMSPEQHFGRPVGPHSDQFSFAITLYEALYGDLPFGADSWEAIRQRVQAGMVPTPLPGSRVPWRLYRVIVRALSLEPDDRWPDLATMIAALEHDPWRSRRRVAITVGLLALASAASYGFARRHHAGGSCEVGSAALAGVWDRARAEAVARAFAATGAPFSQDARVHVEAQLDDYARAWVAESRAACEAQASGGQATRWLDLRLACLGRRRAHLAELVDVFAAADVAVVEHAVQA
ncbi:MAG TPA: serine/threonine-protein kinase, partial [Nannocystis sp.]